MSVPSVPHAAYRLDPALGQFLEYLRNGIVGAAQPGGIIAPGIFVTPTSLAVTLGNYATTADLEAQALGDHSDTDLSGATPGMAVVLDDDGATWIAAEVEGVGGGDVDGGSASSVFTFPDDEIDGGDADG